MHKNYIIDTNVLLYDPNAIFCFQDNHVIIPLAVVKELDKFKREQTELGRNARMAVRMLDDIRAQGNLAHGVKTKNGGMIYVKSGGNLDYADAQILELCQTIRNQDKEIPCIVVTKDINLRIQCDVMGVLAEDYETGQIDVYNELYSGHAELVINEECMRGFRKEGGFSIEKGSFVPNQYILLVQEQNPKDKAMGKVSPSGMEIVPLLRAPRDLGAIQPKNKEQHFLMDALLNNDISLVTIVGKAGTGKTLLSVAVGFYLTVDCKDYMKLLLARPVMPMGNDIGFLPGTVDEKLDPWMRPIYDAFDFIADTRRDGNKKGEKKRDGRELMEESGKVDIEPLVYIRGRSIHRQFMIIDEAQNLTPLEIKTIITRAGPGTKIVLTGDIYQIDHPYMDSMSNGLSYVVSKMKGQDLYAHICLEKGVRSPLSDLAATLL